MLANGRTLALLTPDGKVAWLCHPRPDSPAVFAALLGDDSAGYFSVAPDQPRQGRADAAGAALPARHDDGGDPVVRAHRHRLAARARSRRRCWSGCSPVRCRYG